MTTSIDLLEMVYQAILTADTDADARIYKPGDWPTQPDQYPIVKMRLIGEDRQSLARSGAPEFVTLATIRIAAEVSAPAIVDDAGATGAESQLWALKRQIEVAVINSYPLTASIQQVSAVRSQLAFNSESSTHLAGVQMDLVLEFYEGAESFAPVESDDLDDALIELVNQPPVGALVDLNP